MGRNRIVSVVMVIGIIACISGLISIRSKWKYQGNFEIQALDIKKGTLLLIKNNEETILIGGAEEEEAEKINDYLKTQGISEIDTAIWYEPTKNYTRGYSALIYDMPINKLWVYQEEKIDLVSNELMKKLQAVGCEIKSMASNKAYKGKYNRLKITPTISRDKHIPGNIQVVMAIEAPRLNYIWVPNNNKMSDLPIVALEKRFKPDILNISGCYRTAFLDEHLLDFKNLKTIIIGDRIKMGIQEKKKLEAIGRKVLETRKEGPIILYREDKKYRLTSWREMGISIF